MTNFHPEFQQEPSKPHQCIWLNSEGVRCRSYAMRNKYTCFHHKIEGVNVFSNDAFPLQRPLDHTSLQGAIADVLVRIAANQMDLKRASLLLYGLQVASSNLNRRPLEAQPAGALAPGENIQPVPEPEPAYGPGRPHPSSIRDPIPITAAEHRIPSPSPRPPSIWTPPPSRRLAPRTRRLPQHVEFVTHRLTLCCFATSNGVLVLIPLVRPQNAGPALQQLCSTARLRDCEKGFCHAAGINASRAPGRRAPGSGSSPGSRS